MLTSHRHIRLIFPHTEFKVISNWLCNDFEFKSEAKAIEADATTKNAWAVPQTNQLIGIAYRMAL